MARGGAGSSFGAPSEKRGQRAREVKCVDHRRDVQAARRGFSHQQENAQMRGFGGTVTK